MKNYQTIAEDSSGSLHIWEGKVQVYSRGKYSRVALLANGGTREADVFIQEGSPGIDEVLSNLSPAQRKLIARGWTVHTTKLEDYLPYE